MVLPYTGGVPIIDEYYKSQNIDPLDLLHTDSREYVVTLHNYEDLDDFYKDMELNSNLEPIPDRECECTEKRPKSKSTHYNLTGKEAVTLRNDKRVKIVEETPKRLEDEYGIKCISDWEQTGDWDKAPETQTDLQWGIPRSVAGYNFANWGTDVDDDFTGTMRTTSSGKNVDVVIWDSAHVGPIDHPDFAVNSDGTGGSRIKQINWFQYSEVLGYTTEATYQYTVLDNHATSVASIAAGNRYGWARDANIYSISYDGTTVSGQPQSWLFWALDYIKYWHQHKEINPETGRRNPTIINASFTNAIKWGYDFRTEPRQDGTQYGDPNIIGARTKDVETHGQGVGGIDVWAPSFVGVPISSAELKSTVSTHWPTVYSNIQTATIARFGDSTPFGDPPPNWTDGVAFQPMYVETLADQIEDIVTEGCGSFSSLLFVGAAGNNYFGIDKVPDDGIQNFDGSSGDQGSHFNHDYLILLYYNQIGQLIIDWYPTARGSTPSNSPSAINVGSLDTLVSQYKYISSNFATGIDVWAAGERIITAAINTNGGEDPRDSNYGIRSFNGTSAASPQVVGVLACEMELNPMMNVSQAKRYLKMNCTASLENGSGTNNGNFQDSGSDITEPSEKYGGKSRVGAKRVIKTEVKRNYGKAPQGGTTSPFTSPIPAFGYSYPHQNFGIRQYENENPDSLVSPTWRAPQIFDNKTRGIAYPRSSRSFNRGNFNCKEVNYSNYKIMYDIFYSGTNAGKVSWGLYINDINQVDSGIIDPPSAIPQSVLDSINLVDPITGIPYAYRYEILDYLNLLSVEYDSYKYSPIELVEVEDTSNAIRYNYKLQECPLQCSEYKVNIDSNKNGLGPNLSWSTGISYIKAIVDMPVGGTHYAYNWILKWDGEFIYGSPQSSGTINWPTTTEGALVYDNISVDGYKYYFGSSKLQNNFQQDSYVNIEWTVYNVKRCRG